MCSPRARMSEDMDSKTAFAKFKIDSYEILEQVEGRFKCPDCSRSRKWFCYTCFIPMEPLRGNIPQVKLPIDICIVKHPQEIDGKSTACTAPILAPDSVKMYNYPDLPEANESVLVFPSEDAEDVEDYLARVKKENNGISPLKRIIFIDSTWNQTFKISHHPKFKDVPKVKLVGIQSLFWRYHRGNPTTHLSTIESIYYFCLAYHRQYVNAEYNGEFDNLLFFFRYMFHKIRSLYNPEKLKAYATRPYLTK